MKARPNLSDIPKEVAEYIKDLEGALFGSSRLEQELRLVCDDIAEELSKIRAGGDMLMDGNFDKVLVLFDKTAKIRALQPKNLPKIATKAGSTDDIIEPDQKRVNIQDFVIKNG